MKYFLFAAALFCLIPPLAHAGDAALEAFKALQAADHKMMEGMHNIQSTNDVDRDFVTMMIPHHQGAIDMAKIELQYGKDPEIRKLAEEIIVAQEKEIAQMNTWLVGRSGVPK